MSVSKYADHVLILPEDAANERIANSFVLHQALDANHVRVLPVARGWGRVVEIFELDLCKSLRVFPKRRIILLVDFDEDSSRRAEIGDRIPSDVRDRVFVLGTWSEPERLRKDLGSYETIGTALAEDCLRNTDTTWSHPLLEHNKGELTRLRDQVRPFLFEVES